MCLRYLCTGTDKKVPQKAAKSISLNVDGKSALSSNNHVQNRSTVSVTYFVFLVNCSSKPSPIQPKELRNELRLTRQQTWQSYQRSDC